MVSDILVATELDSLPKDASETEGDTGGLMIPAHSQAEHEVLSDKA